MNQALKTLILDRREQGKGNIEEDNWTRPHNQRREARHHDHEEIHNISGDSEFYTQECGQRMQTIIY